MTRAERLRRSEALAREQLERQRQRLAKVQARQREEERRAMTKRRLLVGQLAQDAGLFALSDADLAGLFAAMAPLVETPDPVALLAGLLSDAGATPGRSLHGCAHAAHGVSTSC